MSSFILSPQLFLYPCAANDQIKVRLVACDQWAPMHGTPARHESAKPRLLLVSEISVPLCLARVRGFCSSRFSNEAIALIEPNCRGYLHQWGCTQMTRSVGQTSSCSCSSSRFDCKYILSRRKLRTCSWANAKQFKLRLMFLAWGGAF